MNAAGVFKLTCTVWISASSTAAAVLNVFLIIIIAKDKSLQQVENAFLVNLAVGNTLMGFLGYFCVAIWNSQNQPMSVCLGFIAISVYAGGVTSFFIVVLTMEKYIQICYPFRYIQICTKRNVVLVILFVHALSIAFMISNIYMFKWNSDTFCSIYSQFDIGPQMLFGFIMFVIISSVAIANIKILHLAWTKKNEVQDIRRGPSPQNRVHATKVFAVLVMFMFVLYIPGFLLIILKAAYELPPNIEEALVMGAATAWLLAPMLDGIAFLFCRQDIRKSALKLIRCQ